MVEQRLKFKILLASKSPRRQEIISQMGLDFRIVRIDVSENYPNGMKGANIAAFLAEKKNEHYNGEILENEILLTADTVVDLNGESLEKPEDEKHAFEMIKKLSGKRHDVISAICLRDNRKKFTGFKTSSVLFKNIPDSHIRYYIENYSPMDKAGAYGIQDWIGLNYVEKIEGSYFNIVGLPSDLLFETLLNW